MPAESRHGEISLSDLGLRVTTSIDSHLEYGGQWIVTMENKNHLFTAEIERLVPSRITEDLRRCLRLTGVGISDISSEFVVLFFDVTFETTFPVHFIIKQSPQNIPIEILPIGRDNYISTTNYLTGSSHADKHFHQEADLVLCGFRSSTGIDFTPEPQYLIGDDLSKNIQAIVENDYLLYSPWCKLFRRDIIQKHQHRFDYGWRNNTIVRQRLTKMHRAPEVRSGMGIMQLPL